MTKIALYIVLAISSAIVIAFLIGLLWAAIVGNEWSNMFGWGDDENDN